MRHEGLSELGDFFYHSESEIDDEFFSRTQFTKANKLA
jgi:hypothetical protein